ncbi:MAG: 4Fe-4S dicluster domain-containing protein [Candidatus Freyarchaeum deiterrae]
MVEASSKKDNNLRGEITETHEGETLNFCYQCSTCSGCCPVFRYNARFNPRKIVENTLLGRKDRTVDSPDIWFCTVCHNCTEKCPQGVKVSEIIIELKNLSSKEGLFPVHLQEEAKALLEFGMVSPANKAILSRREKLGLPVVENAPPEEIRTLTSFTGFDKLVANRKPMEGEAQKKPEGEAPKKKEAAQE